MIVYNLNPLALAATVFVFFVYMYRQYQHEHEEKESELIRRKKLFVKPYPHLYSDAPVRTADHLRTRPQAITPGYGVSPHGQEQFVGQPLKSLANLSRERLDDLMAMEREKLEYLEKYSQIAFPSQSKPDSERLAQQKTNESFQTPKVQANVSKISNPKIMKESEVGLTAQNGQQVPTVNYIVPSICSHCLKTHHPSKKNFKRKTTKPHHSNVIDFTDVGTFNKNDAFSRYLGHDFHKLRKQSCKDDQDNAANNLKKRPVFDFGVDMSRKASQGTDKHESDNKMPINFVKSVTFPAMTKSVPQEQPSGSNIRPGKPQPSLDISIIPHPANETKTYNDKADKSTADQTHSAHTTSINLFAPKSAEITTEQTKPTPVVFQHVQPSEKIEPDVKKLTPNEPLFQPTKQETKKLFNLSAPENQNLFTDFVIKPTSANNMFSTPGSSQVIDLNVNSTKAQEKANTIEFFKPKTEPTNLTAEESVPQKSAGLFTSNMFAPKSESTSAPLFPVTTNVEVKPFFGFKANQYKVDEKSTDINFTQKPFGEDKSEPAKPLFGNLNASNNLFSFANEAKKPTKDTIPKPEATFLNSQTSLDNKEEAKAPIGPIITQTANETKPSIFGPIASMPTTEVKPLFPTRDLPLQDKTDTKAPEPLFPFKPTTNLFTNKTETPTLAPKNEKLFDIKPAEGNLFGTNKPTEPDQSTPKTDNLFTQPTDAPKNPFPMTITAPSFGNAKKSFDEENLDNNNASQQKHAPFVNPFTVISESKQPPTQEIVNPFMHAGSEVSHSKISDLLSKHTPSGLFAQSPNPMGAGVQSQDVKSMGNFFSGVTNLSGQQQSQGAPTLFPFSHPSSNLAGGNPFIQSSPNKPSIEGLFGQKQETGGLFGGNTVPISGLFGSNAQSNPLMGTQQQSANNQGQLGTGQSILFGNHMGQGPSLFSGAQVQGSQLFGNPNPNSGTTTQSPFTNLLTQTKNP
jgi:hypothetical protein